MKIRRQFINLTKISEPKRKTRRNNNYYKKMHLGRWDIITIKCFLETVNLLLSVNYLLPVFSPKKNVNRNKLLQIGSGMPKRHNNLSHRQTGPVTSNENIRQLNECFDLLSHFQLFVWGSQNIDDSLDSYNSRWCRLISFKWN